MSGRSLYGSDADSVATPDLPKPFKTVKTVAGMVYTENGDYTYKGKIRLYMDPRGDVEFAIGVHPWMYKILLGPTTRSQSKQKKDREILTDRSTGVHYVIGPTAKHVLDLFAAIQQKWLSMKDALGAEEHIAIVFHAECPEFGPDGVEAKFVEEAIKLGNRKPRAPGITTDPDVRIALNTYRGLLTPTQLNRHGRPRFYEETEDGRLVEQSFGFYSDEDKYQVVFLPYSDETWDKITNIRRMLSRAAEMLSDLFEKPSDAFLQLIANDPAYRVTALPAPIAPTAKTIRRRK